MKSSDMSINEYFAHMGVKEASHIEVTYKDGKKVALDGMVALMWWRTIHHLMKDNEDYYEKDVYRFRPLDAEGKLEPLSLKEMIHIHVWSTHICSFAGHMRTTSPTYTEIISHGEAALPAILEYLRDNHSGMNVILLLDDIVKDTQAIYNPEPIEGTAFAKYSVKDCVAAWLAWGRQKNYIK